MFIWFESSIELNSNVVLVSITHLLVSGSTPVSKQSRCPQNIYFGDSADVLREKYRENMKQLYSEEESERKVSASQKRVSHYQSCAIISSIRGSQQYFFLPTMNFNFFQKKDTYLAPHSSDFFPGLIKQPYIV